MISLNDLCDHLRERMRFTLQVADQPARFVEGDGPCCPGDQCRNRSFLSWRYFVHGMPVGEGRSAGATVPFPRRCDKCDTAESWAFRQRASRSQAIAWAGCAAALWPCHRSQPRSTSPTGRWRSRRSPPPPIKSRLLPGLLQRFSLGSRCESPSPVPRSCRCAPGAPRYNAARSIRLVARKRHTQRRRPQGPPFFVQTAAASPLARGRLANQASISDAGQRTARAPTWRGSGNEPSRIFL